MADLQPERPVEEGVPEKTPRDTQTEGAHLLVNEVKDRLQAEGFSEDQIQRWADTYIAEGGTGGGDEFTAWIRRQQSE